MTRKVYRTAQGKMVDLGALLLQNEQVRAVGNMGVNARGDRINGWNTPIDTRNQQVARQYNRQTTNVQDSPTGSNVSKMAPAVADIPPAPEDFEDDFVKPEVAAPVVAPAPAVAAPVVPAPVAPAPAPETKKSPVIPAMPESGLAGAIARARQIRQDPIPTPKEIIKNTPGLKKI